MKIVGVDATSTLNALESDMNDFEDAVQTETAKQNKVHAIVTRNKKDFENTGLLLYNPDEYISLTIKSE